MRISTRIAILLAVLILAQALSGCSGLPFLAQPTPTASPTFTPPPTETPLPTPTETATPEPSPTFTVAPPTATLEPTIPVATMPPTAGPTLSAEESIKVFYINKDEAGQYGCGEDLWWIKTNQPYSAAVENDMRFALSTILNYHQPTIGILYHAGYMSQMAVSSVTFQTDGAVHVALTGTWTKTDDPCDGRRFIDQLRRTLKQFPGVSGIVITLNGTPISDALSRK